MDVHSRALDYPDSDLDRVIPDEAELTAGVRVRPGRSYGFFTDTTLCIGCKACEVACKEWNNLPADSLGLTGQSYDNTGAVSAYSWRHVNFIEHAVREDDATPSRGGSRGCDRAPTRYSQRSFGGGRISLARRRQPESLDEGREIGAAGSDGRG